MNKWLALVQALAPMILTTIKPQLAPIASVVSHAIGDVEQMPGMTGQAKLASVVDIANTTVAGINQTAGHQVINPSEINDALVGGINETISVINLLHKSDNVTPAGITPAQ